MTTEQMTLARVLSLALCDPGAICVRRGLVRVDDKLELDPKWDGDVEPLYVWQRAAVTRVLRDFIERMRDVDPPTQVESMDRFIDGWNAAIDHLDSALLEASD